MAALRMALPRSLMTTLPRRPTISFGSVRMVSIWRRTRLSFPSETTALAASGSSFLFGRYGWEYGVPAEAATAFVSFSRVEARQHHWYDTIASSAIAAGYGYVLTTPFKRKYNLDTSLSATPDGGFIQMSYKW